MNTNANSSTTNHWLLNATKKLEDVGVATARLDCLVLLEDFTDKDRAWLLAHPEYELSNTTKLDKKIERRVRHEPLAYIRGKTEFYGREFLVNAHTLEPRPETETMIELLLDLAESQKLKAESKLRIVDVGTGSGCIAVTCKLEVPELEVFAIDIDNKCIETAMKNATKLGADVKFIQGNLLEPLLALDLQLSAVLCNLPYVPNKYQLNEAAKFEPKHAIFGGEDGLDLYRELFNQINMLYKSRYSAEYIIPPRYVLTESLPFQHEELTKLARRAGYVLEKTDDFIQVFRLNSKS